ncbi:hypothetical protein BD626DRAFT_634465 [Schizophyllum amplum]|uniref:F-box domain-containing protein n=1 Tax=Schizophyllum amplum TaxID=97359 RepID=A0A550BZI8_9AGAR|nr:hypothetical protein BD626DRAFT_634465 [Auriculariopsis ampla]
MQILGYVCAHVEFSLIEPSYPVVVVSQVCQRWRAIVLDSPPLWCPEFRIAIAEEWELYYSSEDQDISQMQKKTEQMQIALHTYVQRSGGALLAVRIVGRDKPEERQAKAICWCIVDHLPRWHSLRVTTLVAIHVPRWNFPLLESLTIEYYDPDCYNKYLINRLPDLPQLRKVSVPCLMHLPWDQLKCPHQRLDRFANLHDEDHSTLPSSPAGPAHIYRVDGW